MTNVEGDPSGCSLGLVDLKTKVEFHHLFFFIPQDRGDLPAQAGRVHLRDGRGLQRRGDPANGAGRPEGAQLGTLAHDTQRLGQALHAGGWASR